jgi:hypothetical protein
MNQSTLERVEADLVQHLEKHLSDCLDILKNRSTSGKALQHDLQQLDARLLICRKHIESLGEGYSTTED